MQATLCQPRKRRCLFTRRTAHHVERSARWRYFQAERVNFQMLLSPLLCCHRLFVLNMSLHVTALIYMPESSSPRLIGLHCLRARKVYSPPPLPPSGSRRRRFSFLPLYAVLFLCALARFRSIERHADVLQTDIVKSALFSTHHGYFLLLPLFFFPSSPSFLPSNE